ncbi:MAG: hypothetical protein ACREN8_06215 [Candidatus Dormibacteraceae bacterium]
MGEIVQFPRPKSASASVIEFDIEQLRQMAGLSREEHVTALRNESGWSFPLSLYEAWKAGSVPTRKVRDAALRLTEKVPLGPNVDLNSQAFLSSIELEEMAKKIGLDLGSRDRMDYMLRYPSRVDQECIRQLEQTTIILQKLEGERRPETLLGLIRGHLSEIMSLLKLGSLDTQMRQRLWSVAGETAGVAGWLYWQSDEKDSSAAHFRFGLQAASEGNNRALGAYLMGCIATQPHYRENPTLRLQHLTGRKLGFTQSDAAPATRAWLAVMEAEAYGLLGRAHETFEALNRTEAIMSRDGNISKNGRPAVLSSYGAFFSTSYLEAEEGVVRAKLGETAEAIAVLSPLLATIETSRRKNWYWLYPILAGAHIQQGNIESACELAQESLLGTLQMQIATNLPLVFKVQRQLEPYRNHPAVQQLNESIQDLSPTIKC